MWLWAVMLLVAILSSCTDKTPEPLRIATNIWPGYAPLYLARDLGYYNTPVQLHDLPSSSAVIMAFRNRSLDVAALTLDEALLLAQDGVDARIVLVMDTSNGADVLMARPEIRKLAGLKGKRVGVENGALGAYMLSRILDVAGLKSGDIQVVPLTVDQHEQAYKTVRVDAVVTFEPVRSKLLAQGAKILFDSSKIPDEIFDVLIVHADVLQNRSQSVEQLLEAWYRALDYLGANPSDASEKMARRQQITGREFGESLKGLNIPDRAENRRLLTGSRPALLPVAERLARVMLEHKLLKRPVSPARLLGGSQSDQEGSP